MFCPSCRSEFRAGVTHCQSCDVDLIAELGAADTVAGEDRMAKALADKDLEQLVIGNHVALREVQRYLSAERIPSIIGGEQDEDEPAVAARFYLLVATTDLDNARQKLEARWKKGLAKEGLELAAVTAAGEGACPACNTQVPDGANECPDCGLFLGA
jgi:hypothetical protein